MTRPTIRRLPAARFACLALVLLCGCARRAADRGGTGGLAPGDHEVALRHGGRTRRAIVHVPPRAASAGELPVVIAFHGGGGEAAGYQTYAGLDAVADREGFLVVYPFGTGVLPRRLLTWNAGECCGRAMESGVDDVGFTAALLDDLAGRVPIDRERVFATGHSNGAMMAYRLAVERGDLLAGVAPVAGAMSVDAAPPVPVAVLHVHSVDDPRALYDGGVGPPFPGTDVRSYHRSVEASLATWREANGCAGAARVVEERRGAAGSGDAGQTATLLVWDDCASGRPVAHWRLTGVGHGWPGTERSGFSEEIIGPSTTLIHAAEEVWRFFERTAAGRRIGLNPSWTSSRGG